MADDDRFEAALRDTLRGRSGTEAPDTLDVDGFLAAVRTGARRRRTRRAVTGTVAAVALVAGGGYAITTVGVFGPGQTPLAGHTATTASGSTSATSTGAASAGNPAITGQPGLTPSASSAPPTTHVTVTLSSSGGPILASQIRPLSLTATGTAHQWVLGSTPGGTCGTRRCATLFTTGDGGSSWRTLGQLPARPTTGRLSPHTVSQVRFAGDGRDGWVYGGALWSTHDYGRTWTQQAFGPAIGSRAGPSSGPDIGPTLGPGIVTRLEAWGGSNDRVYADVVSRLRGGTVATLMSSPIGHDDWRPVDLGQPVLSIDDLAVASNVVAVITESDNVATPILLVSGDGVRWRSSRPCGQGMWPGALSTAEDYLWVVCQDSTSAAAVYSHDLGRSWTSARGRFNPGISLAAKSDQALVVRPQIAGVKQVSATSVRTVYPGGAAGGGMFGCTNSSYCYLMSSTGSISRTTDGGQSWSPYVVQPTP
jgi:hypothetical protein